MSFLGISPSRSHEGYRPDRLVDKIAGAVGYLPPGTHQSVPYDSVEFFLIQSFYDSVAGRLHKREGFLVEALS